MHGVSGSSVDSRGRPSDDNSCQQAPNNIDQCCWAAVPVTLGLMHTVLVVLHQKAKVFLLLSVVAVTHVLTCLHMLKQCLIGQLGRLASEF